MSLSKTANTSYVGVALAMFACGANMVQAQCERQKVLSTDGSTGDDFGTSVSVSGDYAIVGAPQADGDTFGTNNAGAAYILKRTGATWSQWGPQITASDRADNDAFGGAVAISGDFAVVGAEFDDDAGLTSGSAYIFRRDADAWVQDVKLTADDAAAFDHFGASVAMADPYVVVGVPFDDEAADNSGSVYVFKRTGATWSFFQKVVNPAPGLGDHFGQAVAIAGGYMLIGVEQDDDTILGLFESGSAYVFTLTPGGWAQPWKLTAVDAASRAFFGHSVSINSETAVIGADRDDVSCGEGGGADCGAVYVFRREKAVWHPDGKLSAADTYPAQMFGSSVASTAGRIVVGTPLDGHAGASSGAAYFFLHDGAEWVQRGKLTATDAASGDGFGTGVSMDGPNVLIGAPNDHVGGSAGRSGSAYLFRLLNLFDFAEFQACMTGALEAAPGPLGAACAAFDCDGDDDIDLADHASFWAVFAGL